MLTPGDRSIIETWQRDFAYKSAIFLSLPDNPRSPEFQEFCDDLSQTLPALQIVRDDDEESKVPTIRIGKNIRYQALPVENELAPFLHALSDNAQNQTRPGDNAQNLLGAVEIPAFLSVFISQLCPYCPSTVRQLLEIAGVSESIRLTVIDAMMFPELSEPLDILSTPTVLLDDLFRWTGTIDPDEIADMMVNRDPSRLSAASLKDMLDQGNAAGVARLMIESKKIFPAFIDLLSHPKWPVRLGAMVAHETLLEEERSLGIEVIDPLWKRFPAADDRVKGDILYVLGESGLESIASKIEAILTGDYSEEVMEAASEALEKIDHQN